MQVVKYNVLNKAQKGIANRVTTVIKKNLTQVVIFLRSGEYNIVTGLNTLSKFNKIIPEAAVQRYYITRPFYLKQVSFCTQKFYKYLKKIRLEINKFILL